MTLALGVLPPPEALAEGIRDTDIQNAARRMASLSDLMKGSRQQVLDDWLPGTHFAMTYRFYGEMAEGLPVLTADGLERMDLLRAYTDAKLLVVGDQKAWSLGVTAAGMAYGLNRRFSVAAPFDGVTERGGGDAFGAQPMDAAYVSHGHVGPVRFQAGYLQSRAFIPKDGGLAGAGELENRGEWFTAGLKAKGVTAAFRASLGEGRAIDRFTMDVNLRKFLTSLDVMEEFLNDPRVPDLGLLTEYIGFKSIVDGAELGYSEGRGEGYLVGIELRQPLHALSEGDDPGSPGSYAAATYSDQPLWLNIKAHYGVKANNLRDLSAKLTYSTFGNQHWQETGWRMGNTISVAYSRFSDPEVVPLLTESVDGALHGFELNLSHVFKKAGVYGFDIQTSYRRNWAHDLIHIVEFADVPIFYIGLGGSYAI